MLMSVVSKGLAIIHNCACSSPNLHPALRQQTLDTLSVFADLELNHITMVMKSMVMIDLIKPDNKLHESYYLENFFITLTDLLNRIYYDNEKKLYWVSFDSADTSKTTSVCNVLSCFHILARAPHYRCRLVEIVKTCRQQVDLLITQSDAGQAQKARSLIKVLSDHACNKCGGAFYFLLKYQMEDALEIVGDFQELAKEPEFHCRLLQELHANKERFNTMLTAGSADEKTSVETLLSVLNPHSCALCGGTTYFLQKHGIEGNAVQGEVQGRPRATRAQGDEDIDLKTVDVNFVRNSQIVQATGFCHFFARCEEFLYSISVAGRLVVSYFYI